MSSPPTETPLFNAVEGLKFQEAGHRYFIGSREVLSVTTVLEEAGISKPFYGGARGRFYAARGTAVHTATQLDDEDDLDEDTLDEQLLGYLEGWREFRRISGFEPTLIEQTVADPLLGYAGTLDRVGMMGGRLVLIDIKTGSVPKWAGPQTGAYGRLILKPVDRYVVRLEDTGRYSLTPFTDRGDADTFLHALGVVHWKRRNA